MSHRKTLTTTSSGFTIVELLVVMAVAAIVSTFAFTFFNTTLSQYFALQQNSISFNDLASHYQRLANVLRGLTDISSASDNDLSVYAYFSPNDAYVSLIHYYISNGQLLADVTPLNANPPNGTLLTAQKKTYTIISQFVSVPGVSTFVYIDGSGTVLPTPVTAEHTVQIIKVNLAVPSKAPSLTNQSLTLQVSLRNRKTNL